MDEGGPWGGSDHSSRCGVVEVVRQLESAPMEKVELVELDRQDVEWERQKGVGWVWGWRAGLRMENARPLWGEPAPVLLYPEIPSTYIAHACLRALCPLPPTMAPCRLWLPSEPLSLT